MVTTNLQLETKRSPQSIHDRYRKALMCHQDQQFGQAKNLYCQIINEEPCHADALHMMGVLSCQEGEPNIGANWIKRAIGANPHAAEYHNNLGIALKEIGDMDGAMACFKKTIEVRPDFGQGHYNLGHVLDDLGNLEGAIGCYKEAIVFEPGLSAAHNNLGNVLMELERPEEALRHCKRAIEISPNFPEAYNNLGNVLNALDRIEEATVCYERAISLKPDSADSLNNLGSILARQGKLKESVSCYLRAALITPGERSHWQKLANALMRCEFFQIDGIREEHLEACLGIEGIDKQGLGRAISTLLYGVPEIRLLLDFSHDRSEALERRIQDGSAFSILSRPVLLGFMEAAIVTDPRLEKLLTEMRRVTLMCAVREALSVKVCEKGFVFLCALAQQCFFNEYVYFVTHEEKTWVEELQRRFENDLDQTDAIRKLWAVLLASYLPLSVLRPTQELSRLAGADAGGLLKKLITRQVEEPAEEKKIRKEIGRITEVVDTISKAVRMQYEENPYPRWVDLQYVTPLPVAKILRRILPHLTNVGSMIGDSPTVLVAGCGTGKHAILCAKAIAEARILAVDVSKSSLAYGIRKAKELGIGNIEFAQADILEFGDLERSFDVIECRGVLHHLRTPLDGFRILAGLLKNGAFMAIGLYSAIGRRPMAAARDFIFQQGYGSSKEDIQQCRQDILKLPDDKTIKLVAHTKDFYTTSSCRDLLFHVQEHCLTLPEISKMLDDVDLEFLGFEMQDPNVMNAYKTRFPEDPSARSLRLWNRYELEHPEIFSSMYQFWVRKR